MLIFSSGLCYTRRAAMYDIYIDIHIKENFILQFTRKKNQNQHIWRVFTGQEGDENL